MQMIVSGMAHIKLISVETEKVIDVVELSPLSLEMFLDGGCLYVQAKRSLYLNQFTNLIYPNVRAALQVIDVFHKM